MGKYSYEVQLRRAGRWTIAEILDERAAAERTADTLLKQHDIDAVRVIRDQERGDGLHSETEILLKERSRPVAAGRPQRLAAEIATAPPCERTSDLLLQAARVALARVLRAFCDAERVTAIELLTSHQLIKRVTAQPELVGGAVDRVVRAQRRHCEEDARVLADRLHALVGRLARRAREAADHPAVRALALADFAALLDDLLVRHPRVKAEYLALAALSRHSLGCRSWLGKLELICAAADGAEEEALAVLDVALADVVAAPGALPDILGEPPNRAAALRILVDFRAGAWEGCHPATARLAALFRRGQLEQTRSALLAACVAGLAGSTPLDGGEPGRERAALAALLEHLLDERGLTGGGAMAEAAVLRAGRWLVHGGRTGRAEALELVLRNLAAPWRRVLFLAELAGAPLGGELAAPIDAALRETLHRCETVEHLLPGRSATAAPRIMQALVHIHARVEDSLLPDAARDHCLSRLDTLLTEFLVRERVIEALDDPGSNLHTRATRLVQFCLSAPLTPRALEMARERVVRHLRQPRFDERLVAHARPAERERLLRDFHQLLASAGFRAP